MRKIEKVTREVVSNRAVEVHCDLCQAKGEPTYEGDESNEWTTEASANNISETTLVMRLGWGCLDGGSSVQHRVDICPECFTDKLLPWLKEEHNVEVHKHETDW